MLVLGKENSYLRVVTSNEKNWLGLESLKMYYEEEIYTEKIDTLILEDLMDYIYDSSVENSEENKDTIKFLDELIEDAIKLNATDIHMESYYVEGRIRYRINGYLEESKILDLDKLEHLITRIKLISKLDISEKRIPQDGGFQKEYMGKEIDFRVSSFPVVTGEKIVIRILDKNKLDFNIFKLGFHGDELNKLLKLVKKNSGMILIVGPSGSGKTTTLYTILNHLNIRSKNIMTIEDPVEYKFRGINQSQINKKANYGFEEGLKSILRQDPDIIMLGEIRNEETAEIACKAAITGHLVMSTLHTKDSLSAINRLLSLGVNSNILSSGLIGVISQRLIRKLCPLCREQIKKHSEEDIILYAAKGCSKCRGGYVGMIPILEILFLSEDMRYLIDSSSSKKEIEFMAAKSGFKKLKEHLKETLKEGSISYEDYLELDNEL